MFESPWIEMGGVVMITTGAVALILWVKSRLDGYVAWQRAHAQAAAHQAETAAIDMRVRKTLELYNAEKALEQAIRERIEACRAADALADRKPDFPYEVEVERELIHFVITLKGRDGYKAQTMAGSAWDVEARKNGLISQYEKWCAREFWAR